MVVTPGNNITGLILAGGAARRMGGQDKGLVKLADRPLIEWAIEKLQPQVSTILINANRNQAVYARYGYPVIADTLPDYCGPLAGMAAALAVCQNDDNCDYLLTIPCDCPCIAPDLATRLYAGLQDANARIAVAHNGERLQPVFALIDKNLLASLESFLADGGRKIDRWYADNQMTIVDFSDRGESFVNANTPEDIDTLTSRIKKSPA